MNTTKPNCFLCSLHDCLMKYASFSGRATRSEYWYFFLAFLLAMGVACAIDLSIAMQQSGLSLSPMCAAIFLFFFIPGTAVCVRRLHDTNRSGWWLLLIGLPLIGWALLLDFLCRKGTPSNNAYSLPPYIQADQ